MTMQEKLRAISGLQVGTRVIGEKPYGERVMMTPGMSKAQKAEAKRIYARKYYLERVKPMKKRGGAK